MKILQNLYFVAALAFPAAAQPNFSTLYSFTNGYVAALTPARGLLYGVFQGIAPTGSNCGAIVELQQPAAPGDTWIESTVYSFAESGDGCDPSWPVVSAGGALYGVTGLGGTYSSGVAYQLKPPTSPGGTWSESIIFNFGTGPRVGFPWSNLVPGPQGSLYVIVDGGTYGGNALLQLRPPATPGGEWSGHLLYSFPADQPAGMLRSGPNGSLYGATVKSTQPDGSRGGGLIFQLSPPKEAGSAWAETVLYNLAPQEGALPNSLTLDSSGAIYGTAFGSSFFGAGAGTVFKLTPPGTAGGDWSYTLLKDFGGNHPSQPLIPRGGKLYGAVATADGQGGGVFQLKPPGSGSGTWDITFLHNFTDGQVPGYGDAGGALFMDKQGTIFGATQDVNAQPNSGTIYQIGR